MDYPIIYYSMEGISSGNNINKILLKDFILLEENKRIKLEGYLKKYIDYRKNMIEIIYIGEYIFFKKLYLCMKYLDITIIKLISKILKRNLLLKLI